MGVKDYEREHLRLVTSTIKGAYKVLQNKISVPTDFLDIVFEGLEQCIVKKMVMHVHGLKTNHDQKVKTLSLSELLNKVKQKYIQLEGSDEWLGHLNQNLSFYNDNRC